ncbi:hypothetical protein [Streptomyces sp. NPDC047453]|uniref:hypothetical protein n=1 Tax=Streptomyces sp. NPDC047453 TaxID=3154812 RepID=UPI0033E5882C
MGEGAGHHVPAGPQRPGRLGAHRRGDRRAPPGPGGLAELRAEAARPTPRPELPKASPLRPVELPPLPAAPDETEQLTRIEHDERQTLLPTLVGRGAGVVKVHVYGEAPGSLSAGADLARKLAAVHGAAKARVVWFLGPEQPEAYAQGMGTRVHLKDFTQGSGQAPGMPVHEDKRLHEGAGFAEFAEQMAGDGFAFLQSRCGPGPWARSSPSSTTGA